MSDRYDDVMRSVLDKMMDGDLDWPRSVPQLERVIDAAVSFYASSIDAEPTVMESSRFARVLHDAISVAKEVGQQEYLANTAVIEQRMTAVARDHIMSEANQRLDAAIDDVVFAFRTVKR